MTGILPPMNPTSDSMAGASEGLTVLLVEDETYFQRFIGELLKRRLGAKVVVAKDGVEALQLERTTSPALVLLDINMPRLNGLDTLRALRDANPTVPVVMLTSVSDEHTVEECVQLGACYFVRKDLPAEQLVAELMSVLGPNSDLLVRKPSAP